MLGRKEGLTKVTDTYLETHDFKVLACEKSKTILSPAECQGKLNERNLRGLVRSIAQFGPVPRCTPPLPIHIPGSARRLRAYLANPAKSFTARAYLTRVRKGGT